MALRIVTDTELTSVADAIRDKTGIYTSMVYPKEFAERVRNVPKIYTDDGTALDMLLSQTNAVPCEFQVNCIAPSTFADGSWTGLFSSLRIYFLVGLWLLRFSYGNIISTV